MVLLQGVAVPPYAVTVTANEACMMLRHLTCCFGVKPQALLLPRQPGCSRVRLCNTDSLQGLLGMMAVEAKFDLLQHTEVFAAHPSPKNLHFSHFRLSHRHDTHYRAGFTALTRLPCHDVANMVPNMASDAVKR